MLPRIIYGETDVEFILTREDVLDTVAIVSFDNTVTTLTVVQSQGNGQYSAPVIEKSVGTLLALTSIDLSLSDEDTALDTGLYLYEVRLTDADSKKYLIKRDSFNVVGKL